jgi:nucleoside-diphosphate-sugar epimerase
VSVEKGAPRVVVIGGSWFIGRALVEALLRRGYAITTVNRGRTPVSYSGPVERVFADRGRPDEFAKVLEKTQADYLIDVTAYEAVDTRTMVKAFSGRLKRALHVSTLSVYRWPALCPIPEEWPLEEDPAYGYGFNKAECERLLFAEAVDRLPWCSIRLPAVYGSGDPISRERFFARRILEGRPILLPEGGRYLCQNIFIDDAVEACCRLLESPRAVGRSFNAGASPFTLEDYIETAGRLLKRPVRTVPVGADLLEATGVDPGSIPYFTNGNLVMETTLLAEEVGFQPAVALKEGLSKTFEWLASGPVVKEDYWDLPPEAEEKILKAVSRGGGSASKALGPG